MLAGLGRILVPGLWRRAGHGKTEAVDPLIPLLWPHMAPRGQQRPFTSETLHSLENHGDLVIARRAAEASPDALFDRLRWGGQVVFLSHRPREVDHVLATYQRQPEFHVEKVPMTVSESWSSALRHARLPRHQFLVIRKVMLERPNDLTVRHSHDVRLEPDTTEHAREGYVVSKRVPTLEQTVMRLLKVRPTMDRGEAQRLATKLVNKVFPIFLTREAAFLKILRGRIPAHLRPRVPAFVRMEQDQRGLVRRLDMSWLRLGSKKMGLLEFARQAATITHALHHHAGVLHFDLRLENMVITDHGVSLIDFGSSVMAGEDLTQSNLLNTLHAEMLASSRPGTQLRRLQANGQVTSSLFEQCYPQRQPAIDLFCLAWFMSRPHAHPDFRQLVRYREGDQDVQRLLSLQRLALAPPDQHRPVIRSVRDLLDMLHSDQFDALDQDTPTINRSPFDIAGSTISGMSADDSQEAPAMSTLAAAPRGLDR